MKTIEVSRNLKLYISLQYELIDLFLIGNSSEIASESNELDYVAVLDDGTDLVDFIFDCSKILFNLIHESNVYVQCFPVRYSKFIQSETMFIKNVIRYGEKI